MKLSIADRLQITNFFPKNADLLTLGIVKEINKKIELTPKEVESISMKVQGNNYQWDKSKEKEIDVKFEKAELELLRNEVNKLDSGKQLTLALYDIAKKIKNEE